MPCNTRTNWEFYAVLGGQGALRFSDYEPWQNHANRLWLFAPECPHAWATADEDGFDRAAFHFSSVPDPLAELARANDGWLSRALGADEVRQLQTQADAVAPHFRTPTRLSPIYIQRLLADLALLLLEGTPVAQAAPALTDLSVLKTERALAWYAEHLVHCPTVEQVAAAVHVSPSHLRRLFWRARNTSPKAAFCAIRLERAQELMGNSTLTLDEVATFCGYTDASHLCREHKAVHRFTPHTWRRRLVDQFSTPPAADGVPPREYQVRPRVAGAASA